MKSLAPLVVLLALLVSPARAADHPAPAKTVASTVFVPAFAEADIDFARTRQFIDGAPAEPKATQVKKALGFHPAEANWEEDAWQLGPVADGKEHVYQYLIVLKAPAAIGTIVAGAGDPGEYQGSRNGGEVAYLKPGAAVPADLRAADPWVKLEFPKPQPHLRYAALPAGTKTQAFLYTDIRAAGPARLTYWQFFKPRLHSVTPTATGYAEGPKDAHALTQGGAWQTARKNNQGVSAKAPSSYLLAWETEQSLAGLFFYSNASQFRLLSYVGPATIPPAAAGVEDWKPIELRAEADRLHNFEHWAYRYRWLATPGLKTRAIKIELTGVERGGQDVWISGLGAFVDLGAAAAPTVAARDDRAPFRAAITLPVGGEASLAVDGPDGRRVRNLWTQLPQNQGPGEVAWDLKDAAGNFVSPGKYQLRGIAGPPVELSYQLTPYPNVQQLFKDRVPWMAGHDSPHGWLSDHCQNWACAARGDRIYFGANMAEAGVALIECELDGRKLWGKHDFGPWTGVNQMAADETAVYIDRNGTIFHLDPATHESRELFQYGKNPERRGWPSAMAAHGGKVALCFTGEPLMDNALTAGDLDLANCQPQPPKNGHRDFFRVLRLEGAPPGNQGNPNSPKPQGTGRLDFEAITALDAAKPAAKKGNEPDIDFKTDKPEKKADLDPFAEEPDVAKGQSEQFALLAFKRPVPLGSVAFAAPKDGTQVVFSVLKPTAPYPPRLANEADWLSFESAARAGWNVLPAPANTSTRALRVKFTRPAKLKGEWFGRLEGLKLLRRRFENAAPTAQVRVSSGKLEATGAWDAARKEAVCADRPGVYLLEWAQPQSLCGLAVQEIDGAVTEIDVWQGATAGPVPLDGPALGNKSTAEGWRTVATFKQNRRTAQYNSDENNRFARYLDGYVDFNEEVTTRAVRLRVVEQWLDNGEGSTFCRKHDGRSEHGLHISQSYAAALDSRLCAIAGVAPLKYLRGEPAVESLVYERVEIYDGAKGTLLKELPARLGWHGLAFNPQGELFGIAKDHVHIVRIDQETGKTTSVIADSQPHTMTIGPDGNFYVHPWNEERQVRVYSPAGKLLRKIGKPGGWKPGPWDPERLGLVHRMCVDNGGSLWLVESDNYPRRIVQFKTDGTFVKEILGNTYYGGGGGGTLNRLNKNRAYYGRVEFEIDWKTHTSKIRGLLADELQSGDITALRVSGQKHPYLVTAPLSLSARQDSGSVYLYDETSGTVRLVAAMGDATHFQPLRTSAVISLLAGGVPRDYSFVWSDRNANGKVDADEIQFTKKPERQSGGVGPFDDKLGCVGPGVHYLVKEFLADGTPIYERKTISGSPTVRLADGKFFTLAGVPRDGEPSQDFVTTPEGAKVWGYPATGGVSGLSIPNWTPGLAANEFSVIGHEIAPADQLGEFLVVHANTGQWKIWTADGLLAGQILLHKTDPRSKFLGPTVAPPGTRLDPLTASQEHFHGFFTKTEADGKYYVILGFTNMSIVEVGGLDRFRRFSADVTVTLDDLARAKAWEATRAQQTIASKALVLSAHRVAKPLEIDGMALGKEWPGTPALMTDGNHKAGMEATFHIAYDNDNLYLCWTGRDVGPLANAGKEYQRYFKTGACLDLMFSTDSKADPKRTQPVAGDSRLLITFVDEKPQAVLYQAIRAGQKTPAESWEAFTPAGGKTRFDRVVKLKEVRIEKSGEKDITVEAAIPLASLGIQGHAGEVLKMDWGILTAGEGGQVKQRQYWSNHTATGTADEAVEARLEPHLWGYLRFEE